MVISQLKPIYQHSAFAVCTDRIFVSNAMQSPEPYRSELGQAAATRSVVSNCATEDIDSFSGTGRSSSLSSRPDPRSPHPTS